MTTRRRKTILLVLAIVAVAFAYSLLRSREPSYHGKRLSYWLRQLQSFQGDYPAEAMTAIRSIGTNAIPFLLEDLEAKDSEWKVKMNDWMADTFSWRPSHVTANARRRMAASGFFALAPLAEPAIPKLLPLLQDQNETLSLTALF